MAYIEFSHITKQYNSGEAAILALDDAMIARNLTCGGCADLLSCLYFLHATASNG